VAGCCECGNERTGSVHYGEFLDHFRKYYAIKKDPTVLSYLVKQYMYVYLTLVFHLLNICESAMARSYVRRFYNTRVF